MFHDDLLQPIEWIPGMTLNLLSTLVSLYIMVCEIRKRRKSSIPFISKSLKVSSISCITSGFVTNLQTFVSVFHGFCHFSAFLGNFTFSIHVVSMGSYLLFRLWHCYSIKGVNSTKKGYPKWLFITLILIGRFIILNWAISLIFSDKQMILKKQCGINSKHQYYGVSADPAPTPNAWIWSLCIGLLFVVWHFLTLGLYAYKIHYFRKEPILNKDVLLMLYKIFILTLFYEIVSLMAASIIGIFYVTLTNDHAAYNSLSIFFFNVAIISVSYSMVLMMDYNESQYIKFLKFLYGLKLHWCCCQYGFIVTDQLNELDNDLQGLKFQDELSCTSPSNIKKSSMKSSREASSAWATISQTDDTNDTSVPPIGINGELELAVITDAVPMTPIDENEKEHGITLR